MNEIFNQNIAAIRKKSALTADYLLSYSPTVDVEISLNNQQLPCCKRNGISLHSFYEPIKEAVKIKESFMQSNNSENVIISGAALFYVVAEFLPHFSKVVVYEADIDLLYSLISKFDYSNLLESIILVVPMTLDFLKDYGVSSEWPIYRHQPSIKGNEERYSSFFEKLRADSVSSVANNHQVKLKILLVGPIYGGSLPIYYYCKEALEELDHTVVGLDFSIHREAMLFFDQASTIPAHKKELMQGFTENLAKTILLTALEQEVDLVIGIAQSPFTPTVLAKLKENGVTTAFWFVEDFRTLQYWQGYANLYDFFFIIQKGQFEVELQKIGCKNFYYLPVAASPKIHCKQQLSAIDTLKYGSDLSFVGAGYYNRRRAFLTLLNYDFKIWGNDWELHSALNSLIQEDGRRVSTEESVKIFNGSKININLHSSSYIEDVNPQGDFVNPRTFEISASQNFQLVDHRSLLAELYSDDEIATYRDLNDLKEKINYFLAHPEERVAYINKSYQRTISEHTYFHRMQKMLNIIISQKPSLQNKKVPAGNRAELLAESLKLNRTDLYNIFSQIDEENINLNSVINYLEKSKKPLDKTGATFLMMQEFFNFARRKKLVD